MVCFLLQCLLDPSRFHNKAISKEIAYKNGSRLTMSTNTVEFIT